MKKLFFALMACLTCVVFAAPKEVEKLAKEMVKNRATVSTGSSEALGAYIVAIGREPIVKDTPKAVNKLYTIARERAKEEIAAFVGTAIESAQRHEIKEDADVVEEYFSSLTTTQVKEMLKGIQDLRTGRNKEEVEVIVYVTSKGSQLAKEAIPEMGDEGTVQAIGIDVNHEEAIRKALVSAVEQVVGTLTVCKRTLNEENELKERLGSTAHGLVDSYRIIGDVTVKDGYKVTIVARVSKRKIYDSYKSFFKALHNPVFYVEASDETLRDEFMQYFLDKGVEVTLNKEKSHYMIRLVGKYNEAINPLTKAKDGTQLALSMSIISKDDEKVLMHLKNTPKKATKYGATLSEEQRKSFVNKRAFKEVHTKLDEAFHDFVLRLLDEAE